MNLAVIPARGGSKGLPGKNIRNLHGKPLIGWSIEAGLSSGLIDKVVVSTDAADIGYISRSFGAEVDIRSEDLAADDTTTIAVLQDLITRYPEADTIVVLQPTSPIRDAGLIDKCINIFKEGKYSNLATGFWCKYKEFGSHNNLRRQDYKGFFYDDGNVYILSRSLVEKGLWCGDNFYSYEIARHQNFEIDDLIDFVIIEALLTNLKPYHE
jgi:CMP-N-acetylneuraminic acid synthetase